ncbi:MAG: PaREP1 family protein [Chloroflexota bacterium]|nr:PaREP1 family protein [Chloroflexota bacterium]
MTTQRYQQASEHFLAQAREELAAGDLPQASEKGWGATAQILKAIAAQRSWEHNRHRHYHRIVSRIRAETGDGDIRRLFNTASTLHENFYENDMQIDDVADGLDDVEVLLDKLVVVLTQA